MTRIAAPTLWRRPGRKGTPARRGWSAVAPARSGTPARGVLGAPEAGPGLGGVLNRTFTPLHARAQHFAV
eukprot:11450511-Alexandrium_andersonii.AAC.1